MEQEFLFNPDGPALAILPATPPAAYDPMSVWIPAHSGWDILPVGSERERSSDTPRFMNQAAASLQSPYYLGHNWSAFRDCVNDLSWLRGTSCLIIFDAAEHLLSESDDDFRILLRLLAEAHGDWRSTTNDFGKRGEGPVTFRSVLACEPAAADALAHRMRDAGAVFARL